MSLNYQFQPQPDLYNFKRLQQQLRTASAARIPLFKQALGLINQRLNQAFYDGSDIRDLVYGRAWAMDQLLKLAWQEFAWPEPQPALLALGGYGRNELHPHSDIDLLILAPAGAGPDYHPLVSQFITLLWDIQLQVGHSFRTLEECLSAAQQDLHLATALMEHRLLAGNQQLHLQLQTAIDHSSFWPSANFYSAKLAEQQQRHAKFQPSDHQLEPNLKSSPGGLRDIQLVGWIAKRHFHTQSLPELVIHKFLTASELQLLEQGQSFLWQVRYALHLLNERCEDRLLFDYQRQLASLFGYLDSDKRLAVEQFMKRYFRVATSITELNEVLLQHFAETQLPAPATTQIQILNQRFQTHNQLLEHRYPEVFNQQPTALLEAFVLMAENPTIQGVRASTIRALRDNRHLIDAAFRQSPQVRQLFLRLLNSNSNLAMHLTRMSRYGILGRLIPAFGHAVGLTQHDLFHIYTVETHTLKLLQLLQELRTPEAAQKFPVATQIMQQLPDLKPLWLAGLFHDLGKGRGGDHSEIGAQIAADFCRQLGLSKHDTHLVTWLVAQHLTLSLTAQKQDLSDPEVIQRFALLVGAQEYLDYLHLLTVADINATNPKLWNSWRAALLNQLYRETSRALRRGLENPIGASTRIEETQQQALASLAQQGIQPPAIKKLWASLGQDYFLHTSPEDVVWHTQGILQHQVAAQPLVLLAPSTKPNLGGTKVFIYALDVAFSFAVTAATLDQLGISIHDARIASSDAGFTLNSLVILEPDGSIPRAPKRLQEIQHALSTALHQPEAFPELIQHHTPRRLKHFTQPTQVFISNDPNNLRTVIEVITPDRPGLLARLGRIFIEFNLWLQKAKIATLGERVEDVFFVTQQDGSPLTDPHTCQQLARRICDELDQQA